MRVHLSEVSMFGKCTPPHVHLFSSASQVQRQHIEVEMSKVDQARDELEDAIKSGLPPIKVGLRQGKSEAVSRKILVKYDALNNLVCVHPPPKAQLAQGAVCPNDRNGKVILDRHSTQRVVDATLEYHREVDRAERAVATVLESLSKRLSERLPHLINAVTFCQVTVSVRVNALRSALRLANAVIL